MRESSSPSPPLNILTALPGEARPLIDHFRLKAVSPRGPFSQFESDTIRLLVSGMGRTAMATAVGYCGGLHGATADRAAWLNIGIAGHASARIGEAFLIHKVTDVRSGRSWYPPLICDSRMQSSDLLTVDRPVADYPVGTAVDMEASGFFEAASRFTTAELIQSIKMISDNPEHPASEFDPKSTPELIMPHLPAIDAVTQALIEVVRELRQIEAAPPGYDLAIQSHRFSVTQRHQLHRLLQKCAVLDLPRSDIESWVSACASGRDFLIALEKQIAAHPVHFQRKIAVPGS